MGRERIAVIGGGMSGMAASILLAENGSSVVLFERQERIGKKILLTGNGRCNISNRDMGPQFYRTADTKRLSAILAYCDASVEEAFWNGLGMELREQRGCLYPLTGQASTVLDCLRYRLEELQVEVRTEAECHALGGRRPALTVAYHRPDGKKEKEGGFSAVFLCCGGKAGVYHEESQNGYAIVKELGHSVRRGHPALVPVRVREDLKAVAGVRAQATVSLRQDDACLATDTGEVQLTKESVSGIPVFQLTRYLDDPAHAQILIDFLPFLGSEDASSALRKRLSVMGGRSLEQFFAGWLQKKLCIYLLKRNGLKPDQTADAVPFGRLMQAVAGMKACPFTPVSLNDYRQAQVSTGGVPLAEVSGTLESLKHPGIFIAGEMLDVTGACGGYNLHFALAGAFAMAAGIRRRSS